jgi:hypothetical protein
MGDRVYRKTKVRRWRTYPNRWGQGVVHLRGWGRVVTKDAWLYEIPRKVGDKYFAWQAVCRIGRTHGEEITDRADTTPVTCKRCLASGWVPPDWHPKEDNEGDA